MQIEVTRAQVVLIFKKGNKADLGNYRPISLLDTTYNIFTTILKQRLAEVLDPYLQPTQYGFRRKKSIANAVYYVRREMEKRRENKHNNITRITRLGKGIRQSQTRGTVPSS